MKEAVEIIQITTTIQEFRAALQAVGKQHEDSFRKTSQVEYYAFAAIINLVKGLRIRVIVRRVGDGKFHFWSVMPWWAQKEITKSQIIRVVGGSHLKDE